MARTVFLVGAVLWLGAAVVAVGIAVTGTEAVEQRLPPLAIDTDALRATIVTIGVLNGLIGAAHVAVLAALRAGRARARTIGILLCALVGTTLGWLAVAAFTTAAVEPTLSVALVSGGLAGVAGALAYLGAALALVGEIRSRASRRAS